MKTYHVYIETTKDALDEGGPLAHVPELPGCAARAKTVDAVKDAIRQAARAYLAFLHAQGERDLPDDFDLEFEEVKDYTLPPDYVPPTPEELARARRWLEASRQAVLAELANLPAEAWDWKPTDNDWPLRAITSHMGTADLWYTDRLMEPERAPLDRLQVTRRAALDRLDALQSEHLGRVTTFDGEDWTPRKVVRRMLEHEQEHLAQIRDLITQYKSSKS
jgi:predicted RNase H-like HicB family nuclease/uncharacterized damage-inducible protein DinB